MNWRKIKGQHEEGETGPRVSENKIFLREDLREDLRKPPRGTPVMKIESHNGTSQRFSEVLLETLSEKDFPLRDSRSCCPSLYMRRAP